MSWDDYSDNSPEETIEDIDDGELFALESATRIPYKDYSKHLAAVEAYEQGLAKRRRYEAYMKTQQDAANKGHTSVGQQTDSSDNSQDPLLSVLQVYDEEGYDADGYDSQGYDREGYNRAGFNRYTGYNRGGYDIHGNSRDGNLTRFPKL